MITRQCARVAIGICVVWCLGMTRSAVATEESAEEPEVVKNGFYLGAMFVYNNMTGDFDDSTYYVTYSDLYDVPDVDSGSGFGAVMGWRRDRGSIEIGYQRTSHDTSSSFTDMAESDASYNVIDMNLKVDVFAKSRVRPYILLGVGIPWLTIEDGSTDGDSYDDETFVGICLDAGAGVSYYFRPQWAVTGGLIYRWNWFTSVDSTSLDDNLSESTLGFTVGVAYTF